MKWEYKHLELDFIWSDVLQSSYGQKELNSLGAQGWELVSIFPSVSSHPEREVKEAVLKRRLDE